jgi:NAD(P)H dehydrogenase (quinone)
MTQERKKVLLINGHPYEDSFNASLVAAYKKGVVESGSAIEEINIGELKFNPNLQFGYSKRTELEPDLLDAQEKIRWADHLVWVHPLWWGGLPAVMKGFIDRILLPGFAFNSRKDSLWWDKLLKGKTARIIFTMDQPYWYYLLLNGKPAITQLKKHTLEFCGIKPVKVTAIGPVKNSKEKFRKDWLTKVEVIGKKENQL